MALALVALSGCATVMPNTTEVLTPVEDELWLAIMADLENLGANLAALFGMFSL